MDIGPMLNYLECQLKSIKTCNWKGREDDRKMKEPSQAKDHDTLKGLCDLKQIKGEGYFILMSKNLHTLRLLGKI